MTIFNLLRLCGVKIYQEPDYSHHVYHPSPAVHHYLSLTIAKSPLQVPPPVLSPSYSLILIQQLDYSYENGSQITLLLCSKVSTGFLFSLKNNKYLKREKKEKKINFLIRCGLLISSPISLHFLHNPNQGHTSLEIFVLALPSAQNILPTTAQLTSSPPRVFSKPILE